mgnify:CR=1 FL=1
MLNSLRRLKNVHFTNLVFFAPKWTPANQAPAPSRILPERLHSLRFLHTSVEHIKESVEVSPVGVCESMKDTNTGEAQLKVTYFLLQYWIFNRFTYLNSKIHTHTYWKNQRLKGHYSWVTILNSKKHRNSAVLVCQIEVIKLVYK